ncbi:MAG: lysophospholipid acyltransferase family protein [Nitrospirota bacterium]
MRNILALLQFLLVVILTLPLALLPYRISLGAGGVMGSLLFFLWKSRRITAIENIKGAISRNAVTTDSTPESIVRQLFRNLGRSFAEVTKIHYGLGKSVIKNVKIEGAGNFHRAHAKGNGVILIAGHCGNWELMAVALSVNLTRLNVVARPIDNPYFNSVIEKTRKKYGNNVIYKKGALKKILSLLKRNETVGILMDQSVIKTEGLITDFLGKKDYTMKTPALIARKTNSPVLPIFIRRIKGGHIIEIGKEIELDRSEDSEKAVLNDTIRFNGYIEEYIRQNPHEWLWIHRRWKRIND